MNEKQANKQRSEAIIQWLSDHPLISRNMLCDIVKYNVSNLHNAVMGKRQIPAKYLDDFEKELKRYGFIPSTS